MDDLMFLEKSKDLLKSNKTISFSFIMTKEIEKSSIDDLELSIRSSNALKRAGIKSIGELVNRTSCYADLSSVRNLGIKSQKEIMKKLFLYQHRMFPEKLEKQIFG